MSTRERSDSRSNSVAFTELSEMSQQEDTAEISCQEENISWELTVSYKEDELLPKQLPPRRPCCKVQYKPRWFFSKGAFLVLAWVMLSTITTLIPSNILSTYLKKITEADLRFEYLFYLKLLPSVTVVMATLLSGWIADTLLGTYRTIKAGMVLLFLSVILFCVLAILLQDYIEEVNALYDNVPLTASLMAISTSLCFIGETVIRVNGIQLGLEQMPDASTDSITSFIAWFVLCEYIGDLLADSSSVLLPCAKQVLISYYFEFGGLLAVLCTTLMLCSDFLFAPKWLTKEPKSKQSMKAIYEVLKYAKQHKHPTHRSSLTYWEEELPSRIDFGKSKYGGPFTIEQVENVKTVLRMLVVSIPIWIVFVSMYIVQLYQTTIPISVANTTVNVLDDCSTAVVKLFTVIPHSWTIVTILIHEFIFYPFIRKSPTTLKRFGAAAFTLVIVCISYQILNIVNLNYTIDDPMRWSDIVQSAMIGILKAFLITSAQEFVCAQSPLDTKNLLIGYFVGIIYISFEISNTIDHIFSSLCTSPYCSIIFYTIATGLSVLGFVLHCILAHWYKRRKRDDDINPQQWVEQAYDRYLQAGVKR